MRSGEELNQEGFFKMDLGKDRVEIDPTRGRFKMDKFDGKGDFGMWKYKLLGQLEIQGLGSVLQEGSTLYKTSEKLEEGDDPVLDPARVAKDT